jgi:hypothetical protein
LAYAAADLFVWATVSSIPFVTNVFWSPVAISASFYVPPGFSGSMFGGNAGFTLFVAIIALNLVMAHAGTRRYALISMLLLGYYALSNDVEYGNLVSFLSFQSSPTWNHLCITVGNATIIIPNLTLLVALATTIVNIMYIWRDKSLTSRV